MNPPSFPAWKMGELSLLFRLEHIELFLPASQFQRIGAPNTELWKMRESTAASFLLVLSRSQSKERWERTSEFRKGNFIVRQPASRICFSVLDGECGILVVPKTNFQFFVFVSPALQSSYINYCDFSVPRSRVVCLIVCFATPRCFSVVLIFATTRPRAKKCRCVTMCEEIQAK